MENTGSNADGMKPLAVIILNWNGRDLLRRFLPSVVEHSDSSISRIVVADNGSDDDSIEVLEREFPQVEILRLEKNFGFAEGYNRAVKAIECKYTILLNSDAAASPGWDIALFDFMENQPDVGACQPKLLSFNNPESFEYAGAAGGYIDCNGYPYCRGRIFDTCEKDAGQYDSIADIHWATGAALMVRRQVYIDCGGLDPEFFAHMEAIDLCWRIRLAGWKIAIVPTAVVYHLGGGSLPAENPRKTYLNFRNNLLMLHKNLPDTVRGKILLRRRLLDTVAWLKFMLTFDFANANAILRAHGDFRRMRDMYVEHPRFNLLGSDRCGRRNILWQYFVRRRKTFDKLK